MQTSYPRQSLIDAAMARRPATLLVKGARIVNVFTGETLDGDVAVLGDRIVAVAQGLERHLGHDTELLDAEGRFAVPGFIEPHLHAGEPSMAPHDLAVALLERGTTTLATDLVEFYALGGPEAVAWALRELEAAGLRTLLLLPLHLLGMERFGTLPRTPTVRDFLEMGSWEQTTGINEPPPITVLDQKSEVVDVLDSLLFAPRVFEGHAPALGGAELQAYLAAGASSDHESTEAAEAFAKLRLGCKVMMRQCAASPDLRRLIPLVLEHPHAARHFMVCSDDMQAKELVADGHIDHKLRIAIAGGVDPVTAIQLATINPAEYLGLAGSLGSIAPGKFADLLLVESLTELRPSVVVAGGTVYGRADAAVDESTRGTAPPVTLRASVNVREPILPSDFVVRAPPAAEETQPVRVIGIDNGTLSSEALVRELPVVAGEIALDIDRDILKAAVLDRHSAGGRIGIAFVHGVGLKRGALATTFTAPHYGLLVIGTSDQEMAAAVAAMRELGGGLVAVAEGAVTAAVRFDVGGVVGRLPLVETHREQLAFERAAGELGCRLTDPLISLASLTIPGIPHYGLSDLGLYDYDQRRFVAPVLTE